MAIEKFTTRKNRIVEIIEPRLDLLDEILEFVNELGEEDTFLSFYPGKKITREEEEVWLNNRLKQIENKSQLIYWAVFDGKIVGGVDITRGATVREWHIGTVGLMVRKDFRGEGLGKFLLEFVLKKAKELGIRTANLGVFSDNDIARRLYCKVGFEEYGKLPDGLLRKNKFSDHIYMFKKIND